MPNAHKTLFESAMMASNGNGPNLRHTVPFFKVKDIEVSRRFYVEGLGFAITRRWQPTGGLRWCWLERDQSAIMLQQYWRDGRAAGWPDGLLGQGLSICFICDDAIAMYHETRARGLSPSIPFVGNGLWVTALFDPDGYRLEFESPTDVPEETVYSPSA
jgi:lactoylglutathione lyase